jgi:hypothetical protein
MVVGIRLTPKHGEDASLDCIDERAAAACCGGRWVRTDMCSTCGAPEFNALCVVTSTTFTLCGEVWSLKTRFE